MLQIPKRITDKMNHLGKKPSKVWTLKATSKEDEPPRLKYIHCNFIFRIVLANYISCVNPDIDSIIHILDKKTKSSSWKAALKALLTLHYLMLRGVDVKI